jgi:hypothetical protein
MKMEAGDEIQFDVDDSTNLNSIFVDLQLLLHVALNRRKAKTGQRSFDLIIFVFRHSSSPKSQTTKDTNHRALKASLYELVAAPLPRTVIHVPFVGSSQSSVSGFPPRNSVDILNDVIRSANTAIVIAGRDGLSTNIEELAEAFWVSHPILMFFYVYNNRLDLNIPTIEFTNRLENFVMPTATMEVNDVDGFICWLSGHQRGQGRVEHLSPPSF